MGKRQEAKNDFATQYIKFEQLPRRGKIFVENTYSRMNQPRRGEIWNGGSSQIADDCH